MLPRRITAPTKPRRHFEDGTDRGGGGGQFAAPVVAGRVPLQLRDPGFVGLSEFECAVSVGINEMCSFK